MSKVLPSFVELLASLELESTKYLAEVPHHDPFATSPSFITPIHSLSLFPSPSIVSPSSSGRLTAPTSATLSSTFPSPSIIISQSSPVDVPYGRYGPEQKTSRRYSPYASILARRRSLPGDLLCYTNLGEKEISRFSSASPPIRRQSLANTSSETSSPTSSPISMSVSEMDQPISSLVRRRQPHRSSQSFELPRPRRRSTSPKSLSPVSIPSLPPLPPISGKFKGAPKPTHIEETRLPPFHTLDVEAGIRRSTV